MKSLKSLTAIVLTPIIIGSCINGPSENYEPRALVIASTEDSIYSGNGITFDGSRSYDHDGEIISYRWDFDDGSTATGEKVMHIYHAVGYFSACLEVTDNEGAKDKDCVDVNVLPK